MINKRLDISNTHEFKKVKQYFKSDRETLWRNSSFVQEEGITYKCFCFDFTEPRGEDINSSHSLMLTIGTAGTGIKGEDLCITTFELSPYGSHTTKIEIYDADNDDLFTAPPGEDYSDMTLKLTFYKRCDAVALMRVLELGASVLREQLKSPMRLAKEIKAVS